MTKKKPIIELRPRPFWNPEVYPDMPPRNKFHVYSSVCEISDLFLAPRFPYYLEMVVDYKPSKKHINPYDLTVLLRHGVGVRDLPDLRNVYYDGVIYRYNIGFSNKTLRAKFLKKIKSKTLSTKLSQYKKPTTRYVPVEEFKTKYFTDATYPMPLKFVRSEHHGNKRSLFVTPSDIRYATKKLDLVAKLPYTILPTLKHHIKGYDVTFTEPMVIFYDKQDWKDAEDNYEGRPHDQPTRLIRYTN